MGVVIYLPVRQCMGCEHFDTPQDDEGRVAAFCTNWDEPIDDERVAAECPEYQPPTGKARP